MRVAFLGLGVMGYPMAGHLKRAGNDVLVYNRTAAKAEAWVGEHGGTSVPTPAAAAGDCDFVFACVGRDEDLRAVTDDAFPAMKTGAVFVDHTTASATIARELSRRAAQAGFGFVDAPVSGGEQGAKNGQLTIMCGGAESDYAKAEPVMAAYAKRCRLLGPAGAGQLTKMVNQICIAGVVQGLSEGLSFARAAGLDGEAVVDVIAKGAAQSWQMENRHKTMLEGHFDHGFAVEWMRKDLGICFDEAARNGARASRRQARGPVLRRGRGDGRQALGYLQPVRASGKAPPRQGVSESGTKAKYHHGDLRNALLEAARALLEEGPLAELSLRAGRAARGGVSHAAPYRHFPNHEALLVELATEGFVELRGEILGAASAKGAEADRIAKIGAAYMRFVARRPALARLMFGPQLPHRERFEGLGAAADAVGEEIGTALHDPMLGLAVWAAVHGLAMLILENVVDLGQRRSGLNVLPSRAEILLRSLFTIERA